MKRLGQLPFLGLIMTGMIASAALLLEARLPLSQDLHFLLEFVWMGVVGAALLMFALLIPIQKSAVRSDESGDTNAQIPELFDEDRKWLQQHPDPSWNEKRI